MNIFFVYIFCSLSLIWEIQFQCKIHASPQLDLPVNKSSSVQNTHLKTNDRSDVVKLSELAIKREESNEIGVDDTLSYDRDRSTRFGPPYSEENDRRYYNNINNDEKYSSRYFNQHYDEQNEDADDKYYSQPRSPYYISDKQRIANGYRDSVVRLPTFFFSIMKNITFILLYFFSIMILAKTIHSMKEIHTTKEINTMIRINSRKTVSIIMDRPTMIDIMMTVLGIQTEIMSNIDWI